jgi:hypothetical protein
VQGRLWLALRADAHADRLKSESKHRAPAASGASTAVTRRQKEGSMSTEFNQKHTQRDNALDESGIGHDFTEEINREIEEAHKFLANLADQMTRQIVYDYVTNIPCGILTRAECKGHGIKGGIVSAIGALVKWDVCDAILLCGDICEDVNAHDTAAIVRQMAYEPDPIKRLVEVCAGLDDDPDNGKLHEAITLAQKIKEGK